MNTPNERGPEMTEAERRLRIRTLNDAFRTTFIGGQVMLTQGIQALGSRVVYDLIQAIQSYDDFTKDNDPHGEHDFGAFTAEGRKIFWKIDCYDEAMTVGSDDPTDPTKTTRVLTIMLAEEY
ncbi:DUF3768 domain-containing protein [Rhodospirillum sp. A1_3_36]|uniref:DUF3768 domain-containing protein n=1 Tax=Rhodospirillum sp. A1_3_36 TaxID=3391666 RepID=UPI0039A62BDE